MCTYFQCEKATISLKSYKHQSDIKTMAEFLVFCKHLKKKFSPHLIQLLYSRPGRKSFFFVCITRCSTKLRKHVNLKNEYFTEYLLTLIFIRRFVCMQQCIRYVLINLCRFLHTFRVYVLNLKKSYHLHNLACVVHVPEDNHVETRVVHGFGPNVIVEISDAVEMSDCFFFFPETTTRADMTVGKHDNRVISIPRQPLEAGTKNSLFPVRRFPTTYQFYGCFKGFPHAREFRRNHNYHTRF